jgi:hypothetical protein
VGEVNSEGVRVDVGEATKGSVSHMKKFEPQAPKGPELVLERLLWLLCEETDWIGVRPGMERPLFQVGGMRTKISGGSELAVLMA